MLCNFLVGTLQCFKKISKHQNIKKLPSKVAYFIDQFFLLLPTSPKPAQISISVPKKLLTAQLMYNDFRPDNFKLNNLSRTLLNLLFCAPHDMIVGVQNYGSGFLAKLRVPSIYKVVLA